MATPATARTFVDFVPRHRLQEAPGEVALRIDLSGEGFRKEQIKVLIDHYGKLRIRGERPLGADGSRWRRFNKDFQVPASCDAASIRARLDKDGFLLITMPRLSAATAGDEEPAAAGANAGGGTAGQGHEPGHTSAQQDAGAPMDRPGQDDEQRPSSHNAAAAAAPDARPAAYGFAKDRRRRMLLAIFAVVLALVAAGLFTRYRLTDPSAETAGNQIVSLSDS